MQNPPGGWGPPPGAPPPYGYPPAGYPPYGMQQAPPAPLWRCPFCGFQGAPLERSKISTAGWVLFVVLLICCLPLFWIGLLIKQKYRVCGHCNHRLGDVG